MKWIIRIIILLVLLVAGVFIFAAFRLNDIAAALKPKIIESVNAATGGEFNFTELNVHAFPSPNLELQKISLSLPQGIKASADSITTTVKLGSIFSGNIDVSSVSINNASGSYTNVGLPKPITFEELNLKTGAKLSTTDLKIDNISADSKILGKIPLNFKGSEIDFNIPTKNISLGGANISLPFGEISLKGSASPTSSDITLNGEKISVKELLIAAATISEAASSLPLDGNVTVAGSAKGFPPTVESTVDSDINYNGLPVSIDAKSVFKGNILAVDEYEISAAQGSIKGNATVDVSNLKLNTTLKGGGFDLSQLIRLGSSPVPLTGKVSSVSLQDFSANTAMSVFSGVGNVAVQTISIPGVNLFGSVIDSIRAIPGLAEMLLQGMSPSAQAALSSSATELSSGAVSFTGKGNTIILTQIEGISALFSISGNGVVEPMSKSGKISLNMYLSEELSATITKKLKGGTGFMENGKIKIPLDIQFSPSGAKVNPKVDGLLKGAALEAGKQILDKALSGDTKGAKDLLGGILGF